TPCTQRNAISCKQFLSGASWRRAGRSRWSAAGHGGRGEQYLNSRYRTGRFLRAIYPRQKGSTPVHGRNDLLGQKNVSSCAGVNSGRKSSLRNCSTLTNGRRGGSLLKVLGAGGMRLFRGLVAEQEQENGSRAALAGEDQGP